VFKRFNTQQVVGNEAAMQRSVLQSSACKSFIISMILVLGVGLTASAESAWVRVSQVGYEAGEGPARAYLMATAPETGATYKVVSSEGKTTYEGKIGPLLGTWAHSESLTYQVYALDFTVPSGKSYTISVSGPIEATSPKFAVESPQALYSGLLINTLFFYETQRDGPNYIPNALRNAPGHLKDKDATIYRTPPLDSNDFIDNKPPKKPLTAAALPNIDAEGGWWDAGDYEKYVETITYTTALMEIGVRDFPKQMGPRSPIDPPAPPNSISYAGDSGRGAPRSSDFSNEANFGIRWLL
jgi:endoglucanase